MTALLALRRLRQEDCEVFGFFFFCVCVVFETGFLCNCPEICFRPGWLRIHRTQDLPASANPCVGNKDMWVLKASMGYIARHCYMWEPMFWPFLSNNPCYNLLLWYQLLGICKLVFPFYLRPQITILWLFIFWDSNFEVQASLNSAYSSGWPELTEILLMCPLNAGLLV